MPAPIRRTDEHGFVIPTSSFEELASPPTPAAKRSRPQGRGKRGWWLIPLLLLAILLGPPAVHYARHLIAAECLERATRQQMGGHAAAALANVNRAIQWEPDPFERCAAYSLRATLRSKGETIDVDGSLADWNEVIVQLSSPEHSSPEMSVELGFAYHGRAWTHELRGEYQSAIADATSAIDLIPLGYPVPRGFPDHASALNTRAYIRAMAGVELQKGLKDAEEALTESPALDPEIVDTRGYLRFRLGQYTEAESDLTAAIAGTKDSKAAELRDMMIKGYPRDIFEHTLAQYDEELGVMHHHLGEVYTKLGQADKAREEFDTATRLGFNPAKGIF